MGTGTGFDLAVRGGYSGSMEGMALLAHASQRIVLVGCEIA